MLGTFLLLPLVIIGVLAVGAAVRAMTAEVDRLTGEIRRIGDLRPALVELRSSADVARGRLRRSRQG